MSIAYLFYPAIFQALTCGQKLYHQTLAIRPKLIKLIEKYSQKKGNCARCRVYLELGLTLSR